MWKPWPQPQNVSPPPDVAPKRVYAAAKSASAILVPVPKLSAVQKRELAAKKVLPAVRKAQLVAKREPNAAKKRARLVAKRVRLALKRLPPSLPNKFFAAGFHSPGFYAPRPRIGCGVFHIKQLSLR